MKNRKLVAASDVILLLFLGIAYAWSVFKKPLALEFGWSDSALTWTFTICMSFFCIGGFTAAQLSKKLKHQTITRISALCVLAGFVIASMVTQLWMLYVSYGVLIGFGIGLSYNAVLSTGNRWFPDRAGFIAGLFLMCFGAGSLIFGPVATMLMEAVGWRTTFLILGGVFFLVFAGASFNVRLPEAGYMASYAPKAPVKIKNNDPAAVECTPGAMLRRKSFWLFLGWSTLLSAVGLALVGQVFTVSSAVGMRDMDASLMVSMVAVCNGLGRLLFGTVYDVKGRLFTMLIITLATVAGSVLLIPAVGSLSAAVLIGALVLLGFGYGGVTPTNSNFVRRFYGDANYSVNFSIVNFNLLISVFIGQFVGSSLYMMTGGYTAMALAMAVLAVLGVGCAALIRKP